MAVYVDKMEASFGNMIMCHMLADTIEELHEMADEIGVDRAYYQSHSIPHYDISKSKRKIAMMLGAIEVDMNKVAEIIKMWQRRKKDG